jgi:hypothetical protein
MAAKRGKTKAKEKKVKQKELLMENFILLQKTLVETVAALKEVNEKVTSMLDLFEEAGKKFSEGQPIGSDISVRLENIEEQNKVIARTLLLLRKQLKEQEKYGVSRAREFSQSISRPRPKKRKPQPEPKKREERDSLFDEDFGAESGQEDEETESSGDEEYEPKPLPEFSF